MNTTTTLGHTENVERTQGFKDLQAELRDIELGVLTQGYTLADAIREGARHTGQATGKFVNSSGNEVCALSAALLSVKARDLT